jgi:hypothetical protein
LDCNPPTYASYIAWIIDLYHHTQLVGWDGGLDNFLQGLVSNHNPPNFCLLSSWDYSHVMLYLTLTICLS